MAFCCPNLVLFIQENAELESPPTRQSFEFKDLTNVYRTFIGFVSSQKFSRFEALFRQLNYDSIGDYYIPASISGSPA